MKKRIHVRFVLQAIAISAVLNLCLVLSEFAGVQNGYRSFFVRIADAIASPPGVIANLFLAPRQHTVHAFVLAAAESLVCSFVFYVLFIWAVREILNLWIVRRNQRADGPPLSSAQR